MIRGKIQPRYIPTFLRSMSFYKRLVQNIYRVSSQTQLDRSILNRHRKKYPVRTAAIKKIFSFH